MVSPHHLCRPIRPDCLSYHVAHIIDTIYNPNFIKANTIDVGKHTCVFNIITLSAACEWNISF